MIYYISIFFFNDTATTEIYTLSLHDALPIFGRPHPTCLITTASAALDRVAVLSGKRGDHSDENGTFPTRQPGLLRSEEHTSELQSRQYLVCRLLLEKKKNKTQ